VEDPPSYSPVELDANSEPGESTSTPLSPSTPAPQKGVFRIGGLFRKEPSPQKEVLVRFIPPQPAVLQGELAIDVSIAAEVVSFLISAILLVSRVDDWKHSQSSLPPRELEAILITDRVGGLPPYSNTSSQTERVTEAVHPTLSNNNRWRWNIDTGHQDDDGHDLTSP